MYLCHILQGFRVTAGVFLIARSSPIYEYSPTILKVIAIIGASTAFFAIRPCWMQQNSKISDFWPTKFIFRI